MRMTVTPAYGRDYPTAKAAQEAWAAGKDFLVNDITSRWDGKPINKSQADDAGLVVTLRFCKLTKTCPAK